MGTVRHRPWPIAGAIDYRFAPNPRQRATSAQPIVSGPPWSRHYKLRTGPNIWQSTKGQSGPKREVRQKLVEMSQWRNVPPGAALRGALVGAVLFWGLGGAPLPNGGGAMRTAEAKAATGIFGYLETEKKGLKAFPKWTGALERHFKDKGKVGGKCTARTFNKCHFDAWTKFLETIKDEPPKRKLYKINRFMNSARYILDPINWGVRDYWATPNQFFKKYGDCEDYAIAKYLSLRAIGWDPKKLRIVVVQDMNLKVPHAILAVYIDGKTLLLDNQISIVVDASKIRHYRPIFSLSETKWWRHAPNRGRKLRRARRARKK